QFSSIVNYHVMGGANGVAQRRPGEIKVVALDPVGSYCASKAEEWLPLRPGTDAAFLLSIANLLVNELGIYDSEYLKNRTNSPYLIGPDGYYKREKLTDKPVVWDLDSSSVKSFDFSQELNCALEGTYHIDGIEYKTAFQLLKEHLVKYTPEYASDITTID